MSTPNPGPLSSLRPGTCAFPTQGPKTGTPGNRLGVSQLGSHEGQHRGVSSGRNWAWPSNRPHWTTRPPHCEALGELAPVPGQAPPSGTGWDGHPHSPHRDDGTEAGEAGHCPTARAMHDGGSAFTVPQGPLRLGTRGTGCCGPATPTTGTAEDPGTAPCLSLRCPQEAWLLVAHAGGKTWKES